jgi:hypothetical protein
MTKSEEERMFADDEFRRAYGIGAGTTPGGIKIDVVDRPRVASTTRASPEVRARILLDCLPESVRVGPHDFAIARQSAFDGDGYLGRVDFKNNVIRMKPHASPTALVETFLHECLHVVWHHGGFVEDGKEEPVIEVFGAALVSLHRDNPWLAGWISGAVQ